MTSGITLIIELKLKKNKIKLHYQIKDKLPF